MLVSIPGGVYLLIDIPLKRVDKLLELNKSTLKTLQAQHSRHRLWYLEVIAVHPSLQSRGLGGGVMRWILDHVGVQPIYLECTRIDNIGFYEGFGFRVVDEIELVDDEDQSEERRTKYWVMVRAGT